MGRLFRYRATIDSETDNYLILAKNEADGTCFLEKNGGSNIKCIREVKLTEYTQYDKEAMKELAIVDITGYATCKISNKEYFWCVNGIDNKWCACKRSLTTKK